MSIFELDAKASTYFDLMEQIDALTAEAESIKDAIKAARLAALEKNICKVIHERTELELIRHSSIRYTDSEIHALKGRIISKLSKELGKLKEGN